MTENNQRDQSRKQYSSEQKFKIVKEVLTTDQTVSQVCKKYGISSALFYRWQDQFMAGAQEGLERKKKGVTSGELRRIEELKSENTRMKDVIAEITSENIGFKKKFGEF